MSPIKKIQNDFQSNPKNYLIGIALTGALAGVVLSKKGAFLDVKWGFSSAKTAKDLAAAKDLKALASYMEMQAIAVDEWLVSLEKAGWALRIMNPDVLKQFTEFTATKAVA